MAVELKKQLDKGEEMRRTKDESIKALQGDFLDSSLVKVFYSRVLFINLELMQQ